MSENALFDYDPMIFDIMVESGTRLAGKYVALADQAQTPEGEARFVRLNIDTNLDIDAVDPRNLDQVKAKTAEYRARLAELRAAS